MKYIFGTILFCVSTFTAAQSNVTDTTTKADASNAGISFNTQNSGSNYASAPVSPGILPPSTGCVLSTVTSGSIGWNAVSGSSSVQTIAQHCLYYEAIKTALAMCQYKTAHKLYDQYVLETFKLESTETHEDKKNMASGECNKPIQPPTIVKEPVVVPPQAITISIDTNEQISCNEVRSPLQLSSKKKVRPTANMCKKQ